jgi:hypothetical protein
MAGMNTRHALVGSLIAAVAIGGYDEYRISGLQAEVAYYRTQLQLVRAAAPHPMANRSGPNVAQALADRELMWNRTFRQSDTCQTTTDAAMKALCDADYTQAREQFVAEHPLTQFMDAQQP